MLLLCPLYCTCLQYDGGYHSGHHTIKALWSIIHELSLEHKRK